MNVHGGFRVILDLHSFFDDQRKKCYYYVDFETHKTVQDMIFWIKQRFNISNNIRLMLNNIFLPENENVRILRDEEVICIIDVGPESVLNNCVEECYSDEMEMQVKKRKKRKHDKISKKDGSETNVHIPMPNIFKMPNIPEKTNNLDPFDSEYGRKKKRKWNSRHDPKEYEEGKGVCKSKGDINTSMTTLVNENILSNNIDDTEKGKGNDKGIVFSNKITSMESPQNKSLPSDTCVSNIGLKLTNKLQTSAEINGDNTVNKNDFNLNELTEEGTECDGKDITNKKRRRRRRKKRNDNIKESSNSDFSFSSGFSNVENRISQNGPKHIKFSDDESADGTSPVAQNGGDKFNICDKNPEGVENSALLPNTYTSAVVDSCNVDSNLVHLKSETAIPRYGTHISGVETLNNGNSALPIFECKRAKQLPSAGSEMDYEKKMDFANYPLLKNPPRENDIVAFKKWKMDDNYCPNISEYISAKVIQAPEDGLISLKVLSGHDELKEPQGKFSLTAPSEEDEQVVSEIIDIVNMNINDLLEIRIIYP